MPDDRFPEPEPDWEQPASTRITRLKWSINAACELGRRTVINTM